MIKVLFILFILLVVLGMVAIRYRKQVVMGIEVWKAFKKMRQAARPPEKQVQAPENVNSPLVKCVKCGTWVPDANAIRLGSNKYCSGACIERSEARV